MILVVREQVFRRETVEMTAAGLEPGENDLAGNRMAFVEVDGGADVRVHADVLIRPWTS